MAFDGSQIWITLYHTQEQSVTDDTQCQQRQYTILVFKVSLTIINDISGKVSQWKANKDIHKKCRDRQHLE
jgi:hypothetical protein